MTRGHQIACGLLALSLMAGCKERTPAETNGDGSGNRAATSVAPQPAPDAATHAPPAPAAVTEPTQSDVAAPAARPSAAAARTYTSVREIFDVVPRTIVPTMPNGWTDLKLAAANRELSQQVVNHPARLTLRVREVGVTAAAAPGRRKRRAKGANPNAEAVAGLPRLAASEPPVGQVPVSLWAYFPGDAIEQAAAINPNDTVAIAGTVTRADLTRDGNGVKLNIDLSDCSATKLAPPPVTAPATEPGHD